MMGMCKNCRHWIPIGQGDEGLCFALYVLERADELNMQNKKPKVVYKLDHPDLHARYFCTPPDFGCNQFQAKDAQP